MEQRRRLGLWISGPFGHGFAAAFFDVAFSEARQGTLDAGGGVDDVAGEVGGADVDGVGGLGDVEVNECFWLEGGLGCWCRFWVCSGEGFSRAFAVLMYAGTVA